MGDIKKRLLDDIKTAMRAKDKALTPLRTLHAAIKQKEINGRMDDDLPDDASIQVISAMIKQRRESAEQYHQGNRPELAETEENEIAIYQNYLPEPLSAEEVATAVEEAVANAGSQGMQAMGEVMAALKTTLQGRTDMAQVSQLVKAKLS